MTLGLHQTYRLNATPLARHVADERPDETKPKLTFAEMAALENKAAGLSEKPSYKPRQVYDMKPDSLHVRIFEMLKARRAMFVFEIVEEIKATAPQIWNAAKKAKSIAEREGFTWHVRDVYCPKRRTALRQYWVLPNGEYPPKTVSTARERMVEFIKANPGADTNRIARAMEISRETCSSRLQTLRRNGEVRCAGGGGRFPKNWWAL